MKIPNGGVHDRTNFLISTPKKNYFIFSNELQICDTSRSAFVSSISGCTVQIFRYTLDGRNPKSSFPVSPPPHLAGGDGVRRTARAAHATDAGHAPPQEARALSPGLGLAGALLVLRKRRAARPPPPLAEPCRGLAWSRLSAAPRAAARGALPEVGPCGGSLDLRRRYYAGCIVGEILLPLLTICLCQCLSEDCTFASFFFLFASFARVNSEKSVDPASASMKLRPNQCQFHP